MVNYDEVKNVIVKTNEKGYVFYDTKLKKTYIESPQNRWCVKGRTLSGKTYFRHLCWNCLKKEIAYAIENQNTLHLMSFEIFRQWDRLLRNCKLKQTLDKFPPPSSNSPVWWFRLIFDISEEDLNNERKKFDTASLQSFVRRYGNDEGKKKFNEYVSLQAKAGCKLEYFVEKYGKKEGEKKYNEVCKSKAVSKKNCIEKYGKEVGQKFFKNYCKKQEYAGCKLGYFIEKYGKEEGEKKYNEVCSMKSNSLTNFIRKYGKEEGEIRYKKLLSHSSIGFSHESQELFEELDKRLGEKALASQYFVKNNEKEVVVDYGNGKSKTFRLDYVLENKVIELNGDYWHCNPSLYKVNDKFNFNGEVFIAKQIWTRDNERLKKLKETGYDVLVVWESAWLENQEEVICNCLKFLEHFS